MKKIIFLVFCFLKISHLLAVPLFPERYYKEQATCFINQKPLFQHDLIKNEIYPFVTAGLEGRQLTKGAIEKFTTKGEAIIAATQRYEEWIENMVEASLRKYYIPFFESYELDEPVGADTRGKAEENLGVTMDEVILFFKEVLKLNMNEVKEEEARAFHKAFHDVIYGSSSMFNPFFYFSQCHIL